MPGEDRRQCLDRPFAAVANAHRLDADGPSNRRRISTDLDAALVEDRVLAGVRRRVALAIPDVGVAGHDPERPFLTTAADQQRHPCLDRRRVVAQVLALHPLAVQGHRLAIQHRPGEATGLVESADAIAQ